MPGASPEEEPRELLPCRPQEEGRASSRPRGYISLAPRDDTCSKAKPRPEYQRDVVARMTHEPSARFDRQARGPGSLLRLRWENDRDHVLTPRVAFVRDPRAHDVAPAREILDGRHQGAHAKRRSRIGVDETPRGPRVVGHPNALHVNARAVNSGAPAGGSRPRLCSSTPTDRMPSRFGSEDNIHGGAAFQRAKVRDLYDLLRLLARAEGSTATFGAASSCSSCGRCAMRSMPGLLRQAPRRGRLGGSAASSFRRSPTFLPLENCTLVQLCARRGAMNLDATVLRAMFRQTSGRTAVSKQEIAEEAGARVAVVDASLGRLRAHGLAQTRGAGSPCLTLAGLAVAVALGSVRPRAWRTPDRICRGRRERSGAGARSYRAPVAPQTRVALARRSPVIGLAVVAGHGRSGP